MKTWVRYVVGAIIGVVLGIVLPIRGGDTLSLLTQLSSIVVRIGRLLVFPLAFFSMIVAVDELRENRRLWKTLYPTAATLVAATFVAVIIGALAVVVLQPQRVPPMVQEGQLARLPNVLSLVEQALPGNLFRVIVLGDNALVMILVLGAAIGSALHFDREITSPVSLVADSANRILYRINGGLSATAGLLLAIPAAAMLVQIRVVEDLMLFGQFLLVVSSAALFVGLVVYPAVIYLLDRSNPSRSLRWLRLMTGPGLAAAASGDVFFSLATMTHTLKEDLGVPRRVGGSVAPLTAVFGRAGTALVSVAGFLLVIRSYTALDVGFGEVVQLIVVAVMYSFLLGRFPAGAVLVLLSYLAARYGRGMEESYLILLPVMPLLERVGAWLDTMTVGLVSEVAAGHSGQIRDEG
ncbi:MAG: dicarboxylate/amino acid:cation symporter [Spirochaetales bacterium]|nr:dicarboxylate/amino acid:cation symporter [Spirochaetales bacterium]